MLSKDFYTPPLRFATQNIEEVARSDGGVKKYLQQRKRIKASTSPLAVSRSIMGCFATAKYRGGVRRTEGLNKIIRNRGNISKYQHPTSVHRR